MKNTVLRLFTEDPIESLWEQLSLYESLALAKRLITSKADEYGLSLRADKLEAKAIALSSCLRNARENIRSGAKSLTIEVTSNYYGCLWLSAAIAVADPRNDADLAKLERSTKGGHGLQNVADNGGEFPGSEFVYLRETGLLADLLKWNGMTDSVLKSIAPKSSIKDYAKASNDDKKMLVSLSDVLARIPELKGLFENVLEKKSLCMTLVADVALNVRERIPPLQLGSRPSPPIVAEPGHFWILLPQTANLSEADVKSIAPPLVELKESPGNDWKGKFSDSKDAPWFTTFSNYHSTLAGTSHIWIPPLLGHIYEPLCIHMMALYQLSIFARYRPAIWHEILEGDHQQYHVLIQSYSRLFSRLGPELALTRLIGQNVFIISPGGLYNPSP